MKHLSSSTIYDEKYAQSYDARFLTSEYAKTASDFELSVLRGLIKPDTKWLDVGCGTGYFLNFFQDINRCGIDLSPDMLCIAKEKNKTAQFIQGDFRGVLSTMNEKWDIISCMWNPYNYLDSMNDFDSFMEKMLSVLNQKGSLFIPVVDLEDLRPHTVVDYDMKTEIYGGNVLLTSTTWTWKEADGKKVHKHLIAPQIGYFIEVLTGHFETIKVVRYPVYKQGWVSKKAIVAEGKFKDMGKSEIVIEQVPVSDVIKVSSNSETDVNAKSIPTTSLLKEILIRISLISRFR